LNFVSLFQPIISTSFSLTRVVSHFSSLVQVGKRSTPLDLSRALRREESEETERGAAERSSHRPRHRLGGKKKASAPRLLPLGAASLCAFCSLAGSSLRVRPWGWKGPTYPHLYPCSHVLLPSQSHQHRNPKQEANGVESPETEPGGLFFFFFPISQPSLSPSSSVF